MIKRPPTIKNEELELYKDHDKNMLSLLSVMDAQPMVLQNGRYLHWDKFRWTLPGPQVDKEYAWFLIKLFRRAYYRGIGLESEFDRPFNFLTHSNSEMQLHQIDYMGKGTFANFSGEIASPELTEKFLVSSLLMEEAITSAQLEGASTTRDIAKKMLEEERAPINEDEQMILNNYLLLKHAKNNKKKELSLDLILEFHKIATTNTTENNVEPGELRTSDDIAVYDNHDEVVHQPPHHTLLETRLKKLCAFANAGHFSIAEKKSFIHPVIKAIILHFMIGYEHPFRDGNGRTARALFYWYMLKNGYDIFEFISISKLLKESPRKYSEAYEYTETDELDLTYFIDYQLEVILEAFKELKSYLKLRVKEYSDITKLLSASRFSDLHFIQKDILKKAVKEHGRTFTVREVVSDYGVSMNTAKKHLETLCDRKLFLKSKDGRTLLYIAPSSLENIIRTM